jgi:hypothetical protein
VKTFILILVLVALVFGYLIYVELAQFMAEIVIDPNAFKL